MFSGFLKKMNVWINWRKRAYNLINKGFHQWISKKSAMILDKETILPETGILGEKPKKKKFHLFWHFSEKKNILPFLAKIHFFLLISRRGSVIYLQNCAAATATGSGASQFLSVAINGFFLRQPLPQKQLQQGELHNLYLLQLQLERQLKPLTVTGTNFDASYPVAVAVSAKKTSKPLENYWKSTF